MEIIFNKTNEYIDASITISKHNIFTRYDRYKDIFYTTTKIGKILEFKAYFDNDILIVTSKNILDIITEFDLEIDYVRYNTITISSKLLDKQKCENKFLNSTIFSNAIILTKFINTKENLQGTFDINYILALPSRRKGIKYYSIKKDEYIQYLNKASLYFNRYVEYEDLKDKEYYAYIKKRMCYR